MYLIQLCIITKPINQILCIDCYLLDAFLKVTQLCPEYFSFFGGGDPIIDKKGIILLVFRVSSYLGIYFIS